jgi:hypothetical protein
LTKAIMKIGFDHESTKARKKTDNGREMRAAIAASRICVLWLQVGEMWGENFCVGGGNRCLVAKAKPGPSALAGKPGLWRLSERRC